jgi:3-methyladenine DNA glycosylase Mpg
MNRIYGKPEAAVVAHVAANPAADLIRSLSLAEKLELLHRLRQGEAVALPVVGPAPPTG